MVFPTALSALLVLMASSRTVNNVESFTFQKHPCTRLVNVGEPLNRHCLPCDRRIPVISHLWSVTTSNGDGAYRTEDGNNPSGFLTHRNATDENDPRFQPISSENDIFRLMQAIGGQLPEKYDGCPSTRAFNLVLRELSAVCEPWTGLRAEEIFVYMLEQHLSGDMTDIQPDIVTFNSVLKVWAGSRHAENAARAHTFLDGLRQLHDRGLLLELKSDNVSYNIVINAYQRSPQRGSASASTAELVFQELVSLYDTTRDQRYRPDVVTFCSILNAASGDAVHVEQMLLRMYKSYKVNSRRICPDSSCFDQVILAWAQKGGERGARRAEMILRLMEDMAEDPKSPVKPTTETYNIVLYALKNSEEMDAPLRVQMILQQMKSNPSTPPDEITYTTSISVWCRLGGRQSLEYTQNLLDQAIRSPEVKVDVPFFANVLSSLASCGHKYAIQFAEMLVEKKMPSLGLEPDITVLNGLLNCFAKRGMGFKAEETLNKLEKESADGVGLVRPDQHTYSIVLDALAKSEAPESITRAESIIKRMQKISEFQPGVRAYTALIQKYARSNIPMKAKRAQEVLKQMKNGPEESHPSVVTYNALLNACEHTPTNSTDLNEKQEAFTIACLAFDEVRKVLQPTHVTYGSFLGVISNLMPRSPARADIAELVFKKCKLDGQVSPLVLRRLKEAVGQSQYQQMLAGQSDDRLPNRWTANVQERRGQKPANKRQSPRNNRMVNKKRIY